MDLGSRSHLDLAGQVSPNQLRRLAQRLGFAPGREQAMAQAFHRNKVLIIVPKSRDAIDYERSVVKLLETLQESQASSLPFEDWCGVAAVGGTTVVKYLVSDPVAFAGSLPLGYFARALSGLFNYLKWNAARATSDAVTFTALKPIAQRFTDGLRAGQSQVGSYVLTVFVPDVYREKSVNVDAETFSDDAIELAISNTAYIAGSALLAGASTPASLSHQIASSILALQPPREDAYCTLRYHRLAQADPDARIVSANIAQRSFDRARLLTFQLKESRPSAADVFVGHIVDLHKDRPTSRTIGRHVTIQVRGDARKVVVPLTPTEYARATQWHANDELVRATGLLNHKARPSRFIRVDSFERLGPDQSYLFSVGDGE